MQLTFEEGRTMKKLLVIAMAAVFSLGVAGVTYAQAPAATEKKMDKAADKAEKKADKAEKKADKAEKKAMDKKADATEKKADAAEKKAKAANPCAAKK
jgi:uncharacterized protein HemX